jgi:hypothetical protein
MRFRAVARSSRLYPTYMKMKYRVSSRARGDLFTGYFVDNIWGNAESVSGSGSTLNATMGMRESLPELLRTLDIRSLLDVPCGDFAWMQHVDLPGIDYLGGDIVREMVIDLQHRFGQPGRRFVYLDVCSMSIPDVDAILMRDLLIHLPNSLVHKTLRNIKSSNARWLITSHYPAVHHNPDVRLGAHRFLNLTQDPFNLPEPQYLLPDSDVQRADKSLGVWSVSAIR